MPWGGTSHSNLGPPTFISNPENAPGAHLQVIRRRQSSIKFSSSQTTLLHQIDKNKTTLIKPNLTRVCNEKETGLHYVSPKTHGKALTVDHLGQETLNLSRIQVSVLGCFWEVLGFSKGIWYALTCGSKAFFFSGILHIWVGCQIGGIILPGWVRQEAEVERLSRPLFSDCFLLCIRMWGCTLGAEG